jgi:TetR/AcrR family transcriptional regulator, transcriptional repressor of aconitase
MPRVTQQHRDDRRAQILAAARRCFLRDGFHGTSMQDLFAEADLSSGAVYGYFAGKDDVILAIAEENMQEIVAMIHTVATTQAPDRTIGATMAGIFEILRTKDQQDGLGGLAVLVWAEALRNHDLRDKFTALLAQLRADLTKVVRDHQREGNMTAEVNADAIAGLLISTAAGYIVQLALLGPAAVKKVPAAALALWP